MGHNVRGIQRKALELLSSKLQQTEVVRLTESETEALLSLVKRLVEMLKAEISVSTDSEADLANSQQMALYCLKLLCRMLGDQHPKAFSEVRMKNKNK